MRIPSNHFGARFRYSMLQSTKSDTVRAGVLAQVLTNRFVLSNSESSINEFHAAHFPSTGLLLYTGYCLRICLSSAGSPPLDACNWLLYSLLVHPSSLGTPSHDGKARFVGWLQMGQEVTTLIPRVVQSNFEIQSSVGAKTNGMPPCGLRFTSSAMRAEHNPCV